MGTDAMKPILGVGEVRFATVHDAVQEGAIAIFDGLRDHMGTFEMIVPQQDQGSNQGLFGAGDFATIEELVEFLVYG